MRFYAVLIAVLILTFCFGALAAYIALFSSVDSHQMQETLFNTALALAGFGSGAVMGLIGGIQIVTVRSERSSETRRLAVTLGAERNATQAYGATGDACPPAV